MAETQFIADLERSLTDLGKQHEEVLARFEEFVDGILSVQIPSLRFHPWTRRAGRITFEFRGIRYLIRHLHVVHESKELSMIELLREDASGRLQREGSVYLDGQGRTMSELGREWLDTIPQHSKTLFYTLLLRMTPQVTLARVRASRVT